MVEICLVRHGQASLGAEDYDRLSELGDAQSQYLGQYFSERKIKFDQVFIGGQKRHLQTWEAILKGLNEASKFPSDIKVDNRLNEYDHVSLINTFVESSGIDRKQFSGSKGHFRLLKKALQAWINGELIDDVADTWIQFEKRVANALFDIRKSACSAEKILVVSSGGPISCILKQVLEVSAEKSLALNLQLKNSSMTQLYSNEANIHMHSFNTIPHLDIPARLDAITYG